MSAPLQLGLDYRPALVNREGIGRATRELVRALTALDAPNLNLNLFGWTLAESRFDKSELGINQAKLHRRRFPAKLTQPWLRIRGGVDGLMGIPSGIFHHTQPSRLPVKSARQTTMIWDLIFLDEDGQPGGPWVEKQTALTMATSAQQAAAESDLILTPTEFVRQDVIAKLNVEASRVATVGLGCNHIHTALPKDLPTRPPFILTVCRVDPRKNHSTMLAAFERLVRAGLPHHWLVVGPDGWRSGAINAAFEASPAAHRIVRIKDAPESQLRGLYATADVFLFASHAEGFGLPPLEAMASGVPVVAAAATCLPEVLGTAAALVDPEDDEALFEALLAPIADRNLRREQIRQGKTQAERFSWAVAAEKHLEAWRRLA